CRPERSQPSLQRPCLRGPWRHPPACAHDSSHIVNTRRRTIRFPARAAIQEYSDQAWNQTMNELFLRYHPAGDERDAPHVSSLLGPARRSVRNGGLEARHDSHIDSAPADGAGEENQQKEDSVPDDEE